MSASRAAKRWAAALHRAAREEGRVDRVRSDLERLSAALASDETLARFVADPTVGPERKERVLLEGVLSGADELVTRLVRLCLSRRREAILPTLAEEFERIDREARGVVEARIVSAREMSAEERERLLRGIERATGRQVEGEFVVDPSLIGGVRVYVGSRLWDGSVRRRLEDLVRRLLSVPVATDTAG